MSETSQVVAELRTAFENGKTRPLEFRIKQLKALYRMYREKEKEILSALYADLRKGRTEAIVMEVEYLVNDLKNTLNNIYSWARLEYVEKDFANLLDKPYIQKEPYGVVLVMGSWNYPLQLLMLPVAGALAAGNCVLIKPSTVAQNCAKLLVDLVPQYLDQECYKVFYGDIPETTELLKERFDYIFFTGSTHIGQIVHAAANKYLTPTTLELGGKSPCYIDHTVNLNIVARRILWGKCCNMGQTCVAPDYILCTKEVEGKFIEAYKSAIKEFYGDNPKNSPDLCRIISDGHFHRLKNLLKYGTIKLGGDCDTDEKYIAPTVLTDVNPKDKIMQEEIFGPILPIININNAYDAMSFIKSKEKPLALYVFSNSRKDVDLILQNTSSGGVCVNDTIMHLVVDTLPFGGVGMSGMGNYHGKYSFDTFSHKKSILYKNLGFLGELLSRAKYPPYTEGKLSYLNFMLAKRAGINLGLSLGHILSFIAGFGALYFWNMYGNKLLSQYFN